MFAQIIQFIGQNATPIGAVMLIVAVTGAFLWRREKVRYATLKQTSDPAALTRMLQTLTGNYTPEVDNLRIEDKVKLLETQQQDRMTRFKWVTICGLIGLGLVLGTIIILAQSERPSRQPGKPDDKADAPLEPPDDRLAKLTDYIGTDWQPGGIDEKESVRRFVVVHTKQVAPAKPGPDDPEEPTLHHSVSFDLSKVAKQGPVRVRAVWVLSSPLEGEIKNITGYGPHPNVRPPLIYTAVLRKDKAVTLAVLSEKEGKKDFSSSVFLTDAEPHVKLVLTFTGESGLYRVHVAVDLDEVKGDRKQTVRTERSLYVAIPPR